jgi:DNA segregation ATPase FtsK/SpoIIIE, S-DNA-T family
MFNTAERITEHEARIHKLHLERNQAYTRAKALVQHGKLYASQLQTYHSSQLANNQQAALNTLDRLNPENVVGWHSDRWAMWDATKCGINNSIRAGEAREQENPAISVPAYLPFIGANKTIIIRSAGSTASTASDLLQSLVIRTAMMLPHQSRYTLLDPAGNGIAFPMRRYLPQVRESSSDIRRDLDQVIGDIQRIIETYLDASITSFELVPPDIRVNERFQFVFAADFPNQYDRRAIEALMTIGNTGVAGGVYLFIHYNSDYDLPHDININGFRNAYILDLTRSTYSPQGLQFQPDSTPPGQVQSQLFEMQHRAKPPERVLDWESIVGLEETQWWGESASQSIETLIGLRGGGEKLNIWFGVKHDQPCAHGMLGAMTGSGKSNLYHVLICGLAIRYSPKDLRLYLIDGKDGVEFQPYRHLPHADVVSLHSSAELSRSVLAELISEKERRNALFSQAGVSDLTAYRRKEQPLGNLPRILLLIDEYQELFEGDRDGIASSCLLQLAQQGRSVGIHMLLASQRFGTPGMLYQPAIFGNIHLRMAMHMTEADVQALTEFGRRGKMLISTCDLPGKIVINDKSGDDSANQTGKAVFLQPEQRDRVIQALVTQARSQNSSDISKTVVFDGQAQPNLIDNPYFKLLVQQNQWPTAKQFEGYARRPEAEGGLGIVDWFEAEHPHMLWFGQEFNVRGYARAIMRRRISEHMLVVGSANTARYGILVAMLASLCASGNPARTQFIIIDRSIPSTQWSMALRTAYETLLLPAGFKAHFTNESNTTATIIDELLVNLAHRRQLGEEKATALPSVFVMMTELDRVEQLRRQADSYGMMDSPAGEKLRQLLIEGPNFGIHLILSFSGVRPMTHVLDERNALSIFRHRIALQMSEDESFTLVRSRRAAQLQIEGQTPVCALYLDMENDRSVRFKPYTTDTNPAMQQESVVDQVQRVGRVLAQRRKTQ